MSVHSIIGGNGTIGEETVRHLAAAGGRLAADARPPTGGLSSAGVSR